METQARARVVEAGWKGRREGERDRFTFFSSGGCKLRILEEHATNGPPRAESPTLPLFLSLSRSCTAIPPSLLLPHSQDFDTEAEACMPRSPYELREKMDGRKE